MPDINEVADNSTVKQNGAVTKKVKLIAIGLVIGLILGACGAVFIQHFNPKDTTNGPGASVVFERVVAQNKLISASQAYSIVDKSGTSGTIPFTDIPIPFTDNSYWYRYVGTIEAGVTLETASFEQNGTTLTITLDEPFISSNTPDMEKSGVLEERNNIFNPIHIEDVDAFRAQCVETSEREALEGGLLAEARVNAEINITGMFNAALGDEYEVAFIWRDADSQQS